MFIESVDQAGFLSQFANRPGKNFPLFVDLGHQPPSVFQATMGANVA
jgi:hypothetical protein